MKAIDLFYGLDNMNNDDVISYSHVIDKKIMKEVVKFYENGFRDIMKWNPSMKEMKFRIKGKIDILRNAIK